MNENILKMVVSTGLTIAGNVTIKESIKNLPYGKIVKGLISFGCSLMVADVAARTTEKLFDDIAEMKKSLKEMRGVC